MHRLVAEIKPYAWGSKTAIAALSGREPSGRPEAELWMGAHPMAPSSLEDTGQSLADFIAADPRAHLGPEVDAAFEHRLPFLFKVLAAAEPLSLQAHPTEAQAAEGFAREEAAKVPMAAPHRNYKDKHHKPELLCALTPFWALSGFRAAEETSALAAELRSPSFSAVCAPLALKSSDAALREVFLSLVAMSASEAEALVREVADRCKVHKSAGGRFHAECGFMLRLATLYPGDVGSVVSLVLNLVRLDPGQAIYMPAGNLHAYLEGTGLEIMASSDNVLRGGLTKKHVDVPELARVLDFKAVSPAELVVTPEPRGAFEGVYRTDAKEFELSRVVVTENGVEHAPPPIEPHGPEIWLVTEGSVRAHGKRDVTLESGQCAFVPADEGSVTVSGAGVVFRAKVPSKTFPA
jgi:mannose-6-phosphate isomerase